MLRHLYRCALCLHPPGFRRRFGAEMLSIFDQAKGRLAAVRLLLDGVVSLARQWTLRPEFWLEISANSSPQAASDGVPSFSTLGPFRPRASAVIDGMVLSITLFCLTCFAIRYSWIHVLHVHIPEVQFDGYLAIHPTSPSVLRGEAGPTNAGQSSGPERSNEISEHLHVDVMPVEAQPMRVPIEPAKKSTSTQTAASPAGLVPTASTIQLTLDLYTGTYVSQSPRLTILIAIQDDHLSAEITGQPKRRLSPASKTTFAVNGVDDSWIVFAPPSDGKIRGLQLFQTGQIITADRQ